MTNPTPPGENPPPPSNARETINLHAGDITPPADAAPPPAGSRETIALQPGGLQQPGYGTPPPPAQPGYGVPPAQQGGTAGPVGKIRGTGVCILLTIVTLGIYSWFWFYNVHEEMKRHKGDGLGGGIALVLAIFVGFIMPFFSSAEVGELYERRGQPKPVSGQTGLWYIPGILLLGIGPIVWFVKTNGALNNYWRSVGATG